MTIPQRIPASGRHAMFVWLTLVLGGCTDGDAGRWLSPTPPPAASTNADLAALTISSGVLAPDFQAATTNYAASVANGVASVTVTATKSDAGASLQINGITTASGAASAPINLAIGETAIPIDVTAADGQSKKNYTITVTRAAPPALQRVTISLLVLETDGSLVEGAAVAVAGTGDVAVTGTDGRTSVPVTASTPRLLRVSKTGLPTSSFPSTFSRGRIQLYS